MNLDAIRGGYERALEWLVVFLMAALAVEVTVGVVFRFSGHSLDWYDEVAAILLAWLTFYGAALASVKRAHIGCPEVMALLPSRLRFVFRVIAEILVIGFFLLMGWMGYRVLGVLNTDYMISLPSIPESWVQSVMPISSVLIVAAELLTLPRILADSLAAPAITGGASH
ncbi:MAG TPA: TRAP transporter small permease [Burkholderiales bacterium]|nr:TRAP transporter small permease [Burkholderiales bacterium]